MGVQEIRFDIDKSGSVAITRTEDGKSTMEFVDKDGDQYKSVLFMRICVDAGFDLMEATKIMSPISKIYELGYIPEEDEFYELTSEQYAKFYKDMGKTDERIFALLPKNPAFQDSARVINCVTESEICLFDKAKKVFNQYCKFHKKYFSDPQQKLKWLTTVLPNFFSAGSDVRRSLMHLV
ncbi:MAG: hypothetical protein LBV52_04550 [Spirochaetaceae bacterium]|jgi:hypothetical protein|nr:hypothetical protein [Spirochaetaceae bacterium]